MKHIVLVALSFLVYHAAAQAGTDFGASCALVNNTSCDPIVNPGAKKGACRMDCSPSPGATEQECRAKGCCWEYSPKPGFPWCFFPGYSPACMLGQVAKDNDKAVKDAAQAYHLEGTQANADAYRSACHARGDNFYSFFVSVILWNNNDQKWKDTQVSLVKYGCNSAKCTSQDVVHIVHRMESEMQQSTFIDPTTTFPTTHGSYKFNVTSYNIHGPPAGSAGSQTGTIVVVVCVCATVVALASLGFIFYRQRQGAFGPGDVEKGEYYARPKDSFHVPESLASKAPEPNNPRGSLMNAQM